MSEAAKILLVPRLAEGQGSGHLVRCAALARKLGSSAALLVPNSAAGRINARYPDLLDGLRMVAAPEAEEWSLVVTDLREASEGEYRTLSSLAPLVGIDEGGAYRSSFFYLIDCLPRLGGDCEPNIADIGFLDLPGMKGRVAGAPEGDPPPWKKALVCFGGEDSAGLGEAYASMLPSILPRGCEIDWVRGRDDLPPAAVAGVRVAGRVAGLKETLRAYDIVFTQFGLLAFEAASAGCAVVLGSPGDYHEALARKAGFASAGTGRPGRAKLTEICASRAMAYDALGRYRNAGGADLAGRIASIAEVAGGVGAGTATCPLCRAARRKSIERFPARSFFRCADCGIAYQARAEKDTTVYGESYFFSEYKAQYGRTYLEDFGSIAAMARKRLAAIEAVRGAPRGASLLDVGCAYGPFLSEARKAGYDCAGIDLAGEAAAHVSRELGIPALPRDLLAFDPAADFGKEGFDVVSLWYVIEHFKDLGAALAALRRLVKPGGLLCISTPSASGVSGRYSRRRFYDSSPRDHYTVWDPRSAVGALERGGFDARKVVIRGHHPERFPLPAAAKAILRPALALASRALSLGDGFEVYAIRKGGVL